MIQWDLFYLIWLNPFEKRSFCVLSFMQLVDDPADEGSVSVIMARSWPIEK
jgi:hypothetical protein